MSISGRLVAVCPDGPEEQSGAVWRADAVGARSCKSAMWRTREGARPPYSTGVVLPAGAAEDTALSNRVARGGGRRSPPDGQGRSACPNPAGPTKRSGGPEARHVRLLDVFQMDLDVVRAAFRNLETTSVERFTCYSGTFLMPAPVWHGDHLWEYVNRAGFAGGWLRLVTRRCLQFPLPRRSWPLLRLAGYFRWARGGGGC